MSSACAACGHGTAAGVKFCSNCGARVGLAAPPAPPHGAIPTMLTAHGATMLSAGGGGGGGGVYGAPPPYYDPHAATALASAATAAAPQAYAAYAYGAPTTTTTPAPSMSIPWGQPGGAAAYSNGGTGGTREVTMAPPPQQNQLQQQQQPKIEVPPAATGDEAAAIYKRMIAAVRGASSHNDEAVSAFKRDCKSYGQGELRARVFYERLTLYFGGAMMLGHMLPQLARLIPDDRMRKKLLKVHAKRQQKDAAADGPGARGATRAGSMSVLATNNRSTSENSAARRPASTSELNNPRNPDGSSTGGGLSATERLSSATSKLRLAGYADSPTCSICSAEFDRLTKRRHRCRKCGASVCGLCSPAKMLIPPEQVATDAKNYDPAHPQRVCTICAPLLQPFQEGLITQYANCHKDNPHESKTRLHLPYSKSLEQECRNAADILGNFFRPDFGANSDRSIPVAFLKRAHGLAFLTVIKAGLFISAKGGTGIVIAKLPDGTWSAPSAIKTTEISGGFEVGGEIVEFMVILGSAGAVKVFHRTQVNIGGGFSVAVGPYGRDASAQAAASRGGINANYSYSHSWGLFAGVSLKGAVIMSRPEVNSNFYGKQLTPEEILNGSVPRPRAAQCLYDAIESAMAGIVQHEASTAQARAQRDWCMHCQCRQFATKPFSKKCRTCGHQHDK